MFRDTAYLFPALMELVCLCPTATLLKSIIIRHHHFSSVKSRPVLYIGLSQATATGSGT